MYVLGTGVDIVEVARLKRAAERTPRLLERLFTPAELAYADSAPRSRWRRLAARFAAKEALFKALGTGLRQVRWREAEVARDPLGRPFFRLEGALADLAARLGVEAIHLSLSHSEHYAVAQVIALGRRPPGAEAGNGPGPGRPETLGEGGEEPCGKRAKET
ncbi:MAG: holo-ACP synthase [Bacillota bacterium]